jgi:hypothetical protein
MMKEGNLSSRVRRTARVELQFHAQISTQDPLGRAETLDAQTLVVSMHGARLACERPFQLNDEVDIFVYLTGKRAKGKVTWIKWDWPSGIAKELRKQLRKISPPYSEENGNEESKNEFAVELYEPQDLWTFLVDSPPQDWQEWKSKKHRESPRIPEPLHLS